MSRKPLLLKLFPAYFLIALISVAAFTLYASSVLNDFYHTQVETDLTVRANMVKEELEREIPRTTPGQIEPLVVSLAETSQARLTLISRDGKVLADSERNPLNMENHADRPEFRQAAQGKTSKSRRISPTLGYTMVYVAVPIQHAGKITAVLRASVAATALDTAPAVVFHRILSIALLIGLFAGIASLLAVRAVSRPLLKMKEAAMRFAEGDFRSKVPIDDTSEFADLGDTLNQMAAQLDQQVRTITRQASEQHAILFSMQEAVVAMDNDDRVLILNPAAERLLGVSLESVKGKTIQEAVRNPDLQRFFERIQCSDDFLSSDEIVLRNPDERIVQGIGGALMDSEQRQIGVLAVFNDVTKTRKLESMRKDFVANVSHELKTPITSIKGFVEVLRDGVIDDPQQSREFLDIVARQSDRLQAIIEDLLELSSIEQANQTHLETLKISQILNAAAQNCSVKAKENGSSVQIDCLEDLTAAVNAHLIEQAITNLIDNAVKYSPGSIIRVSAAQIGAEIGIHVADTGPGIAPEHLPRLFERFYRVDKARSRKQGGTGLGLAIVKHIVQAHNGRTEVKSTVGQGSVFSVYLPSDLTNARGARSLP